jgi:hypothetical protein
MTDEDTDRRNLSGSELRPTADKDGRERGNAFLTKAQREYLLGEKEYANPTTATATRRKIRNRVKSGLVDLYYLRLIPDTERERIFHGDDSVPEIDGIEEIAGAGDLRESLVSLIQFVYLGTDSDIEWLEESIKLGVESAEERKHNNGKPDHRPSNNVAGADVEIDVTRYDVDEIEQRFRGDKPHSLSATEVGVLVRQGRVDPEDLHTLDRTTFGGPKAALKDSEDGEE